MGVIQQAIALKRTTVIQITEKIASKERRVTTVATVTKQPTYTCMGNNNNIL